MNDWNDDGDEELLTPKEWMQKFQGDYDKDYSKGVDDFTAGLSKEECSLITDELKTMRYTPTSSGRADSELNILKAKAGLRQKRQKLGQGAIGSFLKSKARSEGKSQAEINKWADKSLKND